MRTVVGAMIEAIEPWDDREVDHRSDALAWVASGAEIFRLAKPATPPKHLVSYCLLVDSSERSVLLADHRDAQRWLPTGGHVEPGEHPVVTTRREIVEELGIEPGFHPVVGDRPLFVTVTRTAGRSEPHTDVSLWFVFDGSVDDQLVPDPREFAEARWWSFDDVERGDLVTDPHLARCLAKLGDRLDRPIGVAG